MQKSQCQWGFRALLMRPVTDGYSTSLVWHWGHNRMVTCGNTSGEGSLTLQIMLCCSHTRIMACDQRLMMIYFWWKTHLSPSTDSLIIKMSPINPQEMMYSMNTYTRGLVLNTFKIVRGKGLCLYQCVTYNLLKYTLDSKPSKLNGWVFFYSWGLNRRDSLWYSSAWYSKVAFKTNVFMSWAT